MELQKPPQQGQTGVAQQQKNTLNSILGNESIKRRFEEILGKKSAGFMSSIVSATKANAELAKCDPNTVISSAVIAATLDLPIQSNLGFAHIVPYNSKNGMQAQFQMGWKGYVQLALRTGQYKTINATEIYDGELVSYDRISGDVVLDQMKKKSEKIIGYVAYFKLLNGFEKHLYWTREQVEAHGKKYSKSFNSQYGRWQQDFDSMAIKTVLKLLLSKYGILSVDMQNAITADQAVVNDAETMDVTYVDATDKTETGLDKAMDAVSSAPSPTGASPFEEVEEAKIETTTVASDTKPETLQPNGLFDSEQTETKKTSKK
jgi:recombination protein RecT